VRIPQDSRSVEEARHGAVHGLAKTRSAGAAHAARRMTDPCAPPPRPHTSLSPSSGCIFDARDAG